MLVNSGYKEPTRAEFLIHLPKFVITEIDKDVSHITSKDRFLLDNTWFQIDIDLVSVYFNASFQKLAFNDCEQLEVQLRYNCPSFVISWLR